MKPFWLHRSLHALRWTQTKTELIDSKCRCDISVKHCPCVVLSTLKSAQQWKWKHYFNKNTDLYNTSKRYFGIFRWKLSENGPSCRFQHAIFLNAKAAKFVEKQSWPALSNGYYRKASLSFIHIIQVMSYLTCIPPVWDEQHFPR